VLQEYANRETVTLTGIVAKSDVSMTYKYPILNINNTMLHLGTRTRPQFAQYARDLQQSQKTTFELHQLIRNCLNWEI
jgi:hypothetical protein